MGYFENRRKWLALEAKNPELKPHIRSVLRKSAVYKIKSGLLYAPAFILYTPAFVASVLATVFEKAEFFFENIVDKTLGAKLRHITDAHNKGVDVEINAIREGIEDFTSYGSLSNYIDGIRLIDKKEIDAQKRMRG